MNKFVKIKRKLIILISFAIIIILSGNSYASDLTDKKVFCLSTHRYAVAFNFTSNMNLKYSRWVYNINNPSDNKVEKLIESYQYHTDLDYIYISKDKEQKFTINRETLELKDIIVPENTGYIFCQLWSDQWEYNKIMKFEDFVEWKYHEQRMLLYEKRMKELDEKLERNKI